MQVCTRNIRGQVVRCWLCRQTIPLNPRLGERNDVNPRAQFLGRIEAGPEESGALTAPRLFLNWFEELRASVPVTK
jgi:hypothetical protein